MKFKAFQVLRTNITSKNTQTFQLFKGHYGIVLACTHDTDLLNQPRKTFQGRVWPLFLCLSYTLFSSSFTCKELSSCQAPPTAILGLSLMLNLPERFLLLAGLVKIQLQPSKGCQTSGSSSMLLGGLSEGQGTSPATYSGVEGVGLQTSFAQRGRKKPHPSKHSRLGLLGALSNLI